jgi:Spy/CpxP family protein refolding chaperone
MRWFASLLLNLSGSLLMKKIIIALALGAVIPLSAYAAGPMAASGEQRSEARMERMAENLDLSDEQRAKMKSLFEQHKEQRKAMREQMRAQMGEILDDKQMEKMKDMREGRREGRMQKRGKHRMGDCGEKKAS